MKIRDFKNALTEILAKYGLYSDTAFITLLMCAAHESLGVTLMRQIGGGPARGPYGMEKETHDSIWKNSDTIRTRAKKFGIMEDFSRVETDIDYATFVARHYLLMDKNPLPKGYIDTALYLKAYWNRGGKATPEEYIRDYIFWEQGKIG